MPKNLKVLFFTTTYSAGGGSERVLTVLANNLPKNWDVDILEVVSYNRKKEAIKPDINILPYLVWHGTRTKLIPLFIYVLRSHPEIIRAFRRLYGYDVVIGWMAIEGVSILPAFPESKRIAWFHNNIDYVKKPCFKPDLKIQHYIGTYRNVLLFNILKNACENSDNIVTVSKMSSNSMASIYPAQKSKIRIIYNGTDIEELKRMSEEKLRDAKISSLYDKLLASAPVLLCVGQICTRKNFELAVQALKLLKEKNVLCNLVIIGSPASQDEGDYLKEVIKKCNLKENVFLLGYQNNPLPFISRATLLLMTSLDEGFPTVITEAMTFGVPFVTTPVEGASDELSDNGRCGLVADWNAQDYAYSIEKLLKDKELYKTMSDNCKEHIKKYSIENYVGSLQALIDDIPEKTESKYKRQNVVIAILLFIFYFAFYATYKNQRLSSLVRARFDYLKMDFSFLNVAKLLYTSTAFAIKMLFFFPMLLYCSVLVVKYRKRLFSHT